MIFIFIRQFIDVPYYNKGDIFFLLHLIYFFSCEYRLKLSNTDVWINYHMRNSLVES